MKRRKTNPLHFCVAGGDQDVQSAVNIYAVRFERVLDGARHRRARGEVNYIVRTLARRLHSGQIGDAADAKIDLAADVREVLFFTGGKIVQNSDVMAAARQARPPYWSR